MRTWLFGIGQTVSAIAYNAAPCRPLQICQPMPPNANHSRKARSTIPTPSPPRRMGSDEPMGRNCGMGQRLSRRCVRRTAAMEYRRAAVQDRRLIRAGKFRSDVLDAGCGFGEASLHLAAEGYTVVGIDVTPTAIAALDGGPHLEAKGRGHRSFRRSSRRPVRHHREPHRRRPGVPPIHRRARRARRSIRDDLRNSLHLFASAGLRRRWPRHPLQCS